MKVQPNLGTLANMCSSSTPGYIINRFTWTFEWFREDEGGAEPHE